ncbi:hypothetical protein CERSUDRAFT_97734 [Gelatoporia subvermispora B]|uniref:Uncharacterized protein n=1 Tax=Ceriporiopsis subvermispora (strain B) TaxID=914234 RepID=M2QBX6_CERS8|nr:hypothetical protein CERSUDRAFT_97734 [Gelatoporia subvermispora B]
MPPPKSDVPLAKVEFPKDTQPPVLTAGDVSPEILYRWEHAAKRHFRRVALAEEIQTATITSRMEDPRMENWYNSNQLTYDALLFSVFMQLVRDTYLEKDWDIFLCDEILGSQQGQRPFWDWVTDIRNKAVYLTDTPQALDERRLREHVSASVHPELKRLMISQHNSPHLHGLGIFEQWLQALKHLDKERCENEALVKESIKQAIAKVRASQSRTSGAAAPTTTSNAAKPNTQKHVLSTTFVGNKVPKMSDEERRLLSKHNGCYKCRQVEQNHLLPNCPNGFPDPKTFTPVTEANIAEKLRAERAGKVAAVTSVEDTEEDDKENHITAAVLPSSVLEGPDTDKYVFTIPNMFWHCLVDGPLVNTPLRIRALVDDGSHIVMISQELVKQLGLRVRTRPTPLPSRRAMEAGGSGEVTYHQEYVRLRLKSLDSRFFSQTVNAFIDSGCSTDVILGLPFLKINKVVVDSDERTAIVKPTGYDLLTPCVPAPPSATSASYGLSPKQKRVNVMAATMTMVEKLRSRLVRQREIVFVNARNSMIQRRRFVVG